MATAGRAVVASAGTVAISLIALLVIPVPFLRSMGLGGMLIPIVSTLVVLTLLPALLGGIGPRVDWPKLRHENRASRAWASWAAMIVRRRWIAAGVGLALLALLIAPVFGIKIGQAQTSSLASSGSAYDALILLQDGGVPEGVVSPLEMLVEGDSAQARQSSTDDVVANSSAVDGVATAFAPTSDDWSTDSAQLSIGVPEEEAVDSTNASVVTQVNNANADVPGFAGTAGAGAIVLDYIDVVYGNFPWVIALIALVTFLLLARAFRSLLLPLKAVLLNIASVAATFGVVVLFWQEGNGAEEVFGISATGSITFWLPVLIFAFLFGLSMDYEVFILTGCARSTTALATLAPRSRKGWAEPGAWSRERPSFCSSPSSRWPRRPGRTSRSSPRRSVSASCSTPRSCARCSCPRWCLCSGGGTGGCRRGRPGRSGSSRTRRSRRRLAEARVPVGADATRAAAGPSAAYRRAATTTDTQTRASSQPASRSLGARRARCATADVSSWTLPRRRPLSGSAAGAPARTEHGGCLSRRHGRSGR